MPWWIAGHAASFAILLPVTLNLLAPMAAWIVVYLFAPMALAIVKVIAKIRNTPSEPMNDLLVGVIGEFFGADFDGANLATCVGETCNTERAVGIGADILGLLEREFAPDGALSPDQGLKGAQAFAGFAANFAVRSAVIAVLGEAASLGFLKNFRELGSEVARNLSIGRQVRLALRPFFDITIAQPLQWYLHNKYRQRLLSESQAIKANFRGELSDADLATELAYAGLTDGRQASLIADTRPTLGPHEIARAFLADATDSADALARFKALGYTVDDANLIIELNRPSLPPADMERLVRWGVLGEEDAVRLLQSRGFSAEDAKLLLTSAGLARADSEVTKYVDAIKLQTLDGFISKADFNMLVDALPLTTAEASWLKTVTGQLIEIPRKAPTRAEMRKAYEQGVIDLTEWEKYLKTEGFSPDEVLVLTESLLLDQAAKDAAAKTKSTRAALRTKTPPSSIPPTPPKP